MALRVWNTLSGRKEVFEPSAFPKVSFYVCGPTVYDDLHVGNARSAVVFDAIRKHLSFCGYAVRFVMNVTDVDDKIIQRAQKEKKDWRAIADHYTQNYRKVLEALQVAPPDVQPKATEHIGEMIELIEKLIERGKAYAAGADVFFHTPSFPPYGKLSKKNLEEMLDGARVEPHPAKRHPADFSLWKAAKPGEPAWDSPWGKGRPGWHIECSAMARAHLGGRVDIHGGGVDLIFPHHENEIAQCEAAFDEPFVKYWLHNGFLEMGGRKMSKSLGNIQKAKDALARFSGEVLRVFFLSAHYRSPLAYEEEALCAVKAGLDEFTRTLWRLPEGNTPVGGEKKRASLGREGANRARTHSGSYGRRFQYAAGAGGVVRLGAGMPPGAGRAAKRGGDGGASGGARGFGKFQPAFRLAAARSRQCHSKRCCCLSRGALPKKERKRFSSR